MHACLSWFTESVISFNLNIPCNKKCHLNLNLNSLSPHQSSIILMLYSITWMSKQLLFWPRNYRYGVIVVCNGIQLSNPISFWNSNIFSVKNLLQGEKLNPYSSFNWKFVKDHIIYEKPNAIVLNNCWPALLQIHLLF